MNTEPKRNDQYIGDGVYASHDGWQLRLAVGDHNHKVVALDQSTFQALVQYALRYPHLPLLEDTP